MKNKKNKKLPMAATAAATPPLVKKRNKKSSRRNQEEEELEEEEQELLLAAAATSPVVKTTKKKKLPRTAAPVPPPVAKKKLLWERGDFLGAGWYGMVISGFLKGEEEDGTCIRTPVAIKSTRAEDEELLSSLQREKEFLDQLRGCPQIIGCYGDKYTISHKERIYNIVLELAPDGSVQRFLDRAGRPMDELSARRYTRSMLRGLVHIHGNGVVHSDLKPENVMLWGADEVKIIDFGVAMRAGERHDISGFRRFVPFYAAPECIVKEHECASPADLWALGCTVYKMLTRQRAMIKPGGMTDEVFFALRAQGQFLPAMPAAMSDTAKDFLFRCFVADPKKRWTAEMLLKHPFVAAADDNNDDNLRSSSPSSAITSASSSSYPPSSASSDVERGDEEELSKQMQDLRCH